MRSFHLRRFSSKKAIIIGAGLTGPVTALFLKKFGIESTIYEKETFEIDHSGISLAIPTNGNRILKHLDAYDQIKAFSYPSTAVQYWTLKSKTTSIDEYNNESKFGTDGIIIKRSRLKKILNNELSKENIEVKFGKELVDIENNGNKVTAKFKDETQAEADFLLGCDGTFSKTRSITFPDLPQPTFMKSVRVCGISAFNIKPAPEMIYYLGRGGVLSYQSATLGQVYWTAILKIDEKLLKKSSDDWTFYILGEFAQDPIILKDIIMSNDGYLGVYPNYYLKPIPTYYHKNVCLLGSSAHYLNCYSRQEFSLSLEASYLLSNLLETSDVQPAFENYQKLHKPRVTEISEITDLLYSSFNRTGITGSLIREFLFKYYLKRFRKNLESIYTEIN